MEVTTLTTPELFSTLSSEWNTLLHNSTADTPFMTLEWQQTWWDCLGEGELQVVTVRDGGALIGIAPLFLVVKPFKEGEAPKRLLRLIGGVDASDYLDLIAARGREREVFSAIFDVLAKSDQWDAIDLWNVPAASMTRALLSELISTRNWISIDEPQVVCPIIRLPISFEDYLNGLDKKERHELRRKIRRTESVEGLKWYAVTAQDHEYDLDEMAEAFVNLMMQSRSDKSDFMTDQMRRFFHAMIKVTHAGGFLHLSFLEVDGVKAATYLCFDYNSQRLVFNSGLDTMQFQSLSAGIVLAARLIEDAIQRGYTEFDFLRGDEGYKYRLGAKDTQIYHTAIVR
jgi:CelD/BcsL family acetyltransferase involved in cellulose biosynthesis